MSTVARNTVGARPEKCSDSIPMRRPGFSGKIKFPDNVLYRVRIYSADLRIVLGQISANINTDIPLYTINLSGTIRVAIKSDSIPAMAEMIIEPIKSH